MPQPIILRWFIIILVAIGSSSYRHVQQIVGHSSPPPVCLGIPNPRGGTSPLIGYCVSNANVEDQGVALSKNHYGMHRDNHADSTVALKKTFFNHFTRTRFTVDCDDIHRKIFHENDHVRPKSLDIKIELLNISMIEQASMLLTLAHYQPLQQKLEPLHVRWELFTTLVMHADEYYRMQLYDRVLRGFLSRSYGRLHQPSLDYSHESLILVATHRGSGEVVGVTEIYPTKDTYLCNLAVHPSFRRRGLATTLCSYCERIARFAWHSDMMTLHVERRNEEARQFYQSLDYSSVSCSNDLTLNSLLLGEAHLLHFRKPLILINPIHRPEKQQLIGERELTEQTADCGL